MDQRHEHFLSIAKCILESFEHHGSDATELEINALRSNGDIRLSRPLTIRRAVLLPDAGELALMLGEAGIRMDDNVEYRAVRADGIVVDRWCQGMFEYSGSIRTSIRLELERGAGSRIG
jgi:hypothetical protein